ncbi:MAG TPA: hypothetical protein VFS21_00755 [Roseiflexaceae bacterium]|nr:hypothetical protein [Roseiflexaceae bacterium]
MQLVIALLLYPGLLLAMALGLLFGLLLQGRPALPGLGLRGAEGLAGLASLLLTGLATALLPWPLHQVPEWRAVGNLVLLWAAFEGAYLLPLLPGLLDPAPLVARAAAREAQMGAAGRAVLWLAVGAGLWPEATWSLSTLAGHLLVLAAGLLAFPAAAGVGPFGPERSLGHDGAEAGLDDSTAALLRFARQTRAGALLAALLVAALPPAQPWGAGQGFELMPSLGLALTAAAFVVAGLALRQASATLPRFTLPGALRWCWTRALPLALVGLIYLSLVRP